MTTGEIRINHGALEQAAADMRATVNRIDARLHDLERELAPLRSDWTGSAKEAYQVSKTQWDRAINEMKLLLQDTHHTVSTSNDEYRAADRRGAAKFGS